ncbi:MAG: hypothetical protein LBB05_03830 [Puniceicoccales bacterium]|nr:hypothetical protein [Puniceicoccales bacterium]
MLSTASIAMLSYVLIFYTFFTFMLNLCFSDNLHYFLLPLFDEHGAKICDVSGRQVDLIDSRNFKVLDITIQIFSKNKTDPSQSICITSDQANVNSMENIATGSGFITISSDEFSATGSDWKFFGNSKNFILNKNVQVLFKKNQISGR